MEERGWYLERPVPILATKFFSSPDVKNGKEIPILILDTSLREDFENYIRFHFLQKTGECKSNWSKIKEGSLTLVLQFLSPSRCNVLIDFDLKKYSLVVDRIIQGQALWLYPSRKEELNEILEKRVFEPGPERLLLVEIPSKEFVSEWEKLFSLTLENLGLKKEEIEEAKEKWRKL